MADFTEIYKQTGNLCKFAPDGESIAIGINQRLVIRDAHSLDILHLFNCADNIQAIEWSQDSELILVASFRLKCFQVWSLKDQNWTAKIDEGLVGCVNVVWAPDSRHILSFSEFQLRITVWSLVTKSAVFIQHPKFSDKGFQFRSDGAYFAVAESYESKDFISIYDCSDWTLTKRFPIQTSDLFDLAWSPDGRFIAVWESFLTYNIFIYHPDGRLAGTYSAYDNMLGIMSVKWSPSAQFLAIGSFDQKCRLLNSYTWKPLIEFNHPKQVSLPNIVLHKEVDISNVNNYGGIKSWTSSRPKLQYEDHMSPFSIPITKVDPEKPNPKMGVGCTLFNCTADILLTCNENQPRVLWIWDVTTLKQLAVIQQTQSISHVEWNPLNPNQLAFCCGNGLLYLWEKSNGCDAIEVPAVNFNVVKFYWNPDGKSLVLLDKEKFCLSFMVDDE
ncbi:hypothetical protein BC833DRAFT_541597 [Globomyces pollinis-pini]|nr:hypothetical protein BC833DRAFT_541597 [Globomyces pollinis-pini]